DDEEEEEKNLSEPEIEIVEEKQNLGLRIQDIQEEKDKLLIETADMLHLNIFAAEILLKKHSWSKQNLLNAWIEDAKKCCEKCGLSSDVIKEKSLKIIDDGFTRTDNLSSVVIARKLSGRYVNKKKMSNSSSEIADMCSICFASDTDLIKIICGHQFCKNCWQQYLTMKIEEGNVNEIVCPQTDCFAIIPNEIVESLVSKETAQKYLHFDLKASAFVDSNPTIKWCPYPECGMAVKNPSSSSQNESESRKKNTGSTSREYSRSVDCGNGHYFCWDCLQEGHEPASCKIWKDWFEKILEMKPEE
ncbi:ankyrin repeat and IBR domain-containing, partial [Brachionus plicatilis]